MDPIKTAEEKMLRTLEITRENLAKIRSGRASPALLADIRVEAYGTLMHLQQLATVQATDAKTLTIKPFDKANLSAIEKAILKANIGLTPSREADALKIRLPPMTEESRRSVLKIAKQEVEDCKVAIRNIRHEILKKLKDDKDAKLITEDQLFKGREKLDQLAERSVKQADELYMRKEKEILES
ncbi:MAG: ribosome recycling factor [bacterium JZ-2024 1]